MKVAGVKVPEDLPPPIGAWCWLRATRIRLDARQALEALCQTYWEPLYAHLRRLDHSPPDAEDLTQGFFAHLLSNNGLAGVCPAKGRVRSFLLTALKHFLLNERVRAQAAKRGGRCEMVPVDPDLAERRYALESPAPCTAECLFDRRWAMTMLQHAHARLRREYETTGKAAHFAELSVFLTREGKAEEYEAAARLQTTAGAVPVAVHRLRKSYRDHIRAEVAQTVSTAAELEEEMRYLLEVLVNGEQKGTPE